LSSEFKRKTVVGVGWNFINQAGNQGVNFFFSIFLARILGPEDYGLIAMVSVFTGFIGVFVDFGFGAAAVQRDHVSEKEWSTIFISNFIIGAVLVILLFFIAPIIGEFYQITELIQITRIIGLGFLISSLSIVLQNKLIKEINFKAISIVSIISSMFSGLIGIILAYNNFGVYSLVGQRISNYLLNFIGLWIANKFWIPKIFFSISFIKNLFNFSFYIFLSGLLNYSTRNLDNLVIGKSLGDKSLGEYNRAYSFLMFPIGVISRVINSVLFPTFSIIKNDLDKISHSFKTISLIASSITIPVMAIFYICASEIVLIVFGEKWIEISPLIEAFTILGVYQSVLSLNSSLYMALAQNKLDFKLGLFTEFIFIVSILVGIKWGITGVIIGLYVGTIINFVPSNHFILNKIGLSIRSYYSLFVKNFLISLIIAIGIKLFFISSNNQNTYIAFFIKSSTFSMLYFIFHFLFKTKEYESIMQLIFKDGFNKLKFK
jgi:O-antigen/teichoic acid export membrane protein